MIRRETIKVVIVALLTVIVSLAALGYPVGLWLTKDQQADQLQSSGKYIDAAGLYSDPLRQGVAYFRGGDFKAAAGAFARVDEPESAFDRGNSLVMLGKYDEAVRSYDRALQLRPEWTEAQDNRAIATARRARMEPPEDDAGGTGGMLEADEIVFDDRAKNASQTQEVEVGAGEPLSDENLRELWLRRVQTQPGDFLRAKFAYQISRRDREVAD